MPSPGRPAWRPQRRSASFTCKYLLAYDGGVGADLFKALDDATRRAILDELVDRDGQTLFEICSRLTMKHGLASTRQAISQHLAVLEDAGLVTTERRGPLQAPPPRHDARCARDPAAVADTDRTGAPMRITLTSVFVDDQAKALAFYTGRPRLPEAPRHPDGRRTPGSRSSRPRRPTVPSCCSNRPATRP